MVATAVAVVVAMRPMVVAMVMPIVLALAKAMAMQTAAATRLPMVTPMVVAATVATAMPVVLRGPVFLRAARAGPAYALHIWLRGLRMEAVLARLTEDVPYIVGLRIKARRRKPRKVSASAMGLLLSSL